MRKTIAKLFVAALAVCLPLCFVACADPVTPGKTVYTVTVVNGEGGGKYYENDNVRVTATVPDGKEFDRWTIGDEIVSVKPTYVFTVKNDTEIVAHFVDAVGDVDAQTFTVTAENGVGGGIYAQGRTCMISLVQAEADRKFVGWATVKDGVAGDIVSEDREYSFTVTENVELKAVLGDVRLATPTDRLFIISRRSAEDWLIELDRMKDDNGAAMTVFTPSVAYVRCWLYDDATSDSPVGSFKFAQKAGGGVSLITDDGTAEINVIGSPGNYYQDWIKLKTMGDFLKAAIGDKYNAHTNYYVATQLIAVDDPVIEEPVSEDEEAVGVYYANSLISPKTSNYFCEDASVEPVIYTVKVENGTIDGDLTEKQFELDELCTITAAADPDGKAFLRWMVNGEEFSRENPYTFKVQGNMNFKAEYADQSETLALISLDSGIAYPEGKEEEGVKSLRIFIGEKCMIKAADAPRGQKFSYWYYLDADNNEIVLSNSAEYTFTVTQTLKIKAKYDLYYSVTLNYVGTDGAPIDGINADVFEYVADSMADVAATVPAGYGFVKMQNAAGEVLTEFYKYTFKITENTTFTVTLSDELITLATPENGNNQMFKFLHYGDTRNTTEFDRQKNVDGSRKTAFVEGVDYVLYYMYDMDGNLVGKFKLEQTTKGGAARVVTLDGSRAIGAGNTPGDYYIDNTSKETFYAFWRAVAGDNYDESMRYYFAAQAVAIEKSVYVTSGISVIGTSGIREKTVSHRITVENGTGGGTYEKYSKVTLTANDIAGKRFVRWTVNGEEVSAQKSFEWRVTADVTVVAEYINVYNVTVEGGKINGETDITVDENTEITSIPDEGDFLAWMVDGVRVPSEQYGDGNSLKLTIDKDTVIVAVFDVKVTLTVVGGKAEGETQMEVTAGAEITLTADAPTEQGTKFAYWYVMRDGNEVVISDKAEFLYTVTDNVTIIAKFRKFFIVTVTGGYVGDDEEAATAEIFEGDEAVITPIVPEGKGYVKWVIDGADFVDYAHKLTVTANINAQAVFGDQIKLDKLENGNNQMFKYIGWGDTRNTTEFDRQKEADGTTRKTAFTEGVDYVLYYVYDATKTNVLGTFKLEQTTRGGAARVVTMDGSVSIGVGSTPGNYYIDNTNVATFFGFWKAVLGENYKAGDTVYFAAQAIACEHTVYVDGEMSEIGTSGVTLKQIEGE